MSKERSESQKTLEFLATKSQALTGPSTIQTNVAKQAAERGYTPAARFHAPVAEAMLAKAGARLDAKTAEVKAATNSADGGRPLRSDDTSADGSRKKVYERKFSRGMSR